MKAIDKHDIADIISIGVIILVIPVLILSLLDILFHNMEKYIEIWMKVLAIGTLFVIPATVVLLIVVRRDKNGRKRIY